MFESRCSSRYSIDDTWIWMSRSLTVYTRSCYTPFIYCTFLIVNTQNPKNGSTWNMEIITFVFLWIFASTILPRNDRQMLSSCCELPLMFKKNGDYYDLQRMRTIVFLVHLNVLLYKHLLMNRSCQDGRFKNFTGKVYSQTRKTILCIFIAVGL